MEKTKHDQASTSEINRTLINIKQSSDNINNDNNKSRRDSCVIDNQKPTCSKYTMPWICNSKNETGFSSQTSGQERNDNKILISTKDSLETMQQESEFKNKRYNGVQEKINLTLASAEIKCNHCQRVCKSSKGLKLHIKACKGRLSSNINRETHTLTPLTTVTSDVEVSSPDCIVETSQILNADELVIEHEETTNEITNIISVEREGNVELIANSDELIIERFGAANVQNLAETLPYPPKHNIPFLPEIDISPQITNNAKSWGEMSHQLFVDTINSVYEEIVKYRRNIYNIK